MRFAATPAVFGALPDNANAPAKFSLGKRAEGIDRIQPISDFNPFNGRRSVRINLEGDFLRITLQNVTHHRFADVF